LRRNETRDSVTQHTDKIVREKFGTKVAL
jgi:hypothetical protein